MDNIIKSELEKVYSSATVRKLNEYYNILLKTNDYHTSLVNFIAAAPGNSYSYGKTIADETLHRQGKNRSVSSGSSYRLSKYYEELFNPNEDVDEVFIDIINRFLLITNEELNNAKANNLINGVKLAKNSVKTLLVLLFASNLYDLLNRLELPNYVLTSINNLLTMISQSRSNVFNHYKNTLKDAGYEGLVDTVDQIGMDEFFEYSKTKSQDMFRRFFKDQFEDLGIIDSDEVNKLKGQYESFKELYHSYYDKLLIKDVITYFNQPDATYTIKIYDNTKNYVINKINDISENLGDNSLINKLIYNENK